MLTSMDDLVKALASRPITPIYKASATAKAAGSFQSLWRTAGFPTVGNIPASGNGEIPTKNTVGALNFTNAVVGKDLYLGKLGLQGSTAGTFMLYDRLWVNSGLDGTVTTAQTFTMPSLTRHTDAVGVEAYLEIYTATGSTAVTATINYTNSDGVSGRTGTASIVAAPAVGQMFPFSLASGDEGVKSIQSVTLSATTGTAGNFGLTLLKRKAEIPLPSANIGTVLDAVSLGLPPILNDSCLAFMVLTTATNTGNVTGTTCIIEG